ncbi:MAG: BON domain-containing protein [Deltaproteobacteria bacterium]|nr:BON domain-containing protein [Deltaproteobacteria bacterium]
MKRFIICMLLAAIAGCSATPMRRAFKEGWRDANITSKVKWKLTSDKLVKAHNLDVDTWRGVVTITGRATSEEEKAKAGTLAQSVKKVKEVRNLIDVVGADSVPQKVVRENIPFSKPAGKFAKPEEIALPTIDTNKKPATIGETELTEENKALATVTEDPVEQSSDAAVSSTPVDKDVTLQAEQELKELKAKKK